MTALIQEVDRFAATISAFSSLAAAINENDQLVAAISYQAAFRSQIDEIDRFVANLSVTFGGIPIDFITKALATSTFVTEVVGIPSCELKAITNLNFSVGLGGVN
jgi:hypothetical protein